MIATTTNYENYNLQMSFKEYMSIEEMINQHNYIFDKNIKNDVQEPLMIENIVIGDEVNKYISPVSIEKWNNGSYDLWEVRFKINNASEKLYSMIKSIEVILYKDNEVIAKKVTVEGGIEELKKEDIFYGGIDGKLSCSFKERNKEESTRYWKSSPFLFATPDTAQIKLDLYNEDILTTYIAAIDNTSRDRPKLKLVK